MPWQGTNQGAKKVLAAGIVTPSRTIELAPAVDEYFRHIWLGGVGDAAVQDSGDFTGPGADNTIPIVLEVRDELGNPVAAAHRIRVRVTGSATLSETGAGTEVSGTATNDLLFDTSAAGAATVLVTDTVDEQVTVTWELLNVNATTAAPVAPHQAILDRMSTRRITFAA